VAGLSLREYVWVTLMGSEGDAACVSDRKRGECGVHEEMDRK
jgi:hypothetical protein